MAKGVSQKLKIIYLMKILLEKTDEEHSITMQEIKESLEAYGIGAERKSLYSDIESLRQYGMDIIGRQMDRTYYYSVGNRQFELAELKLLVDSVQAAKFITAKKSNELIKKIESMASKYEASKLHRQVYVAERVKTMNESIYYNVDMIHAAIGANSKITFQYFQWNVDKKMELRRGGSLYEVSPWALSWSDENYYLIAFDSLEDKIKHFRVDKMLHIEMEGSKREGKKCFDEFDMAIYTRKMFGMFGGEEQMVKIECENALAGVMIDRFGKDVAIMKKDGEHFTVIVKVAVSRQFLSWVIALGEGAKIVGPESIVEQMKKEVDRLTKQYR
ncbi:MAG: WYL domain-containing protein [Lachnospiraceae bacterium]|nr:WYL domain-containing protein [Lachnospiraceae bacterium]